MSTRTRPRTPYTNSNPVSMRGKRVATMRGKRGNREINVNGSSRLDLTYVPAIPTALAARMGDNDELSKEDEAIADWHIKAAMEVLREKHLEDAIGNTEVLSEASRRRLLAKAMDEQDEDEDEGDD